MALRNEKVATSRADCPVVALTRYGKALKASDYSNLRARFRGCGLRFRIPMRNLHLVSGLCERLLHLLRNEYRPMLAAGTSERNRKIALPFANVMRQQVDEQIGYALDELARLRERHHVFCDLGVRAVERTQLGNEVRVGQKAHVEDEIGVIRDSLLVAEAHSGDEDALAGSGLLKALDDVGAQLVHREFRGIDNDVCLRADWGENP